MPSTLNMITGLVFSGGILVAGGYAASSIDVEETKLEVVESISGERIDRPGTASSAMRTLETIATASTASGNEAALSTDVSPSPSSTRDTLSPVAGVSLTITDVRNDSGNVIVLIFDDKDAYRNYDYTKAVEYLEIPAKTGTLSVEFPSLNAGPYAIGVFHDENGDQDLNVDNNGYPTEGYGTSGASGPYDDPGFKKAAVEPGAVTVRMHYLQ